MSVKDQSERRRLRAQFIASGFPTVDLSDDFIAKEHIRHMVGGHASGATDELLMSFEFPEKPGALKILCRALFRRLFRKEFI